MKRTLLLIMVGLLAAALLSCNVESGLNDGDGSTGGGGQAVFSGRLLTRPVLFIPEAGRASVLTVRDQLLAAGRQVSEDGAVVVWPDAPAAGWLAQVGNLIVRADENGVFIFQGLPSGVTEGTLTHPADSRVVLTFPVDRLTPGTTPASAFVYPQGFDGACGMSPGEDDAFCANVTRTVQAQAETILAQLAPVPTAVTTGPRGTYPLGKATLCADKDGFFPSASLPKEVRYIGSTCDGYVRVGCCPNENPFSDVQYNLRLAAASIPGVSLIRGLIGNDFYLSPPSDFSIDIGCSDNHKGRFCQQVSISDLSVDLTSRGQIVKPADRQVTVDVLPGSVEPLTIHNNGCFGITLVRTGRLEIVGGLSGPGFKVDVPSATLQPKPPQVLTPRVEHFAPLGNSVALVPAIDRDLMYTIPADAQPGSVDEVLFSTDTASILVIFRVVAPNVSTPQVSLDNSSVLFQHEVNITPCNQGLPALSLSSQDTEAMTVTVSFGANSGLEIPGGTSTFTLNPGGNLNIPIEFNCSRQDSYNTSIMVTVSGQDNPTRTRTFNVPVTAILLHRAVRLDFPLGPFTPGTEIRLSRIVGGHVAGAEGGCPAQHYHGGPISVDGIHVADDPNPSGCGYGRIVLTEGGGL